MGNAVHYKEDGGFSPEAMEYDTRVVSDDFYTESCVKLLLFLDKYEVVPAMRRPVIKKNCKRPTSRARFTMVESHWNCSNTFKSSHTFSRSAKYVFS